METFEMNQELELLDNSFRRDFYQLTSISD